MSPAQPTGDPAPSDGLLPASVLDGAERRSLSLYVHVPYCSVRCGYCDFNTYTATELGPVGGAKGASVATFVDAAISELDLALRSVGTDRPVSTVFVGGGTPTLLPPQDLVRFLDAVRERWGLADDAERERRRTSMGEPYRTLLGHFRHEIGHYYFYRLVSPVPEYLERFNELFGDPDLDYQAALDRHYSEGAPAGWKNDYVSSYATMHPAEDWAETFAHYLHIRDTLDTLQRYGASESLLGVALAAPGNAEQALKLWRQAVDVGVDPVPMVATLGSKEGLASLATAITAPGTSFIASSERRISSCAPVQSRPMPRCAVSIASATPRPSDQRWRRKAMVRSQSILTSSQGSCSASGSATRCAAARLFTSAASGCVRLTVQAISPWWLAPSSITAY